MTEVRNRAYLYHIVPVCRARVPVISIGNLSLGGTGKTELVLWGAEKVLQWGKKPVILSRGYGRSSKNPETLNWRSGKIANPDIVGDEPYMISQRLKEVTVVVDLNRIRGAELACEKFFATCLFLDDGFQHRRIHRDWNVVCLDENILKAPMIFPAGILREGIDSLHRADFITVKSDGNPEDFLNSFKAVFSQSLKHPFAFFRYQAAYVRNHLTGTDLPATWLEGKKILAFSGLAHPESFERIITEQKGIICSVKRFPDHHFYEKKELQMLKDEANQKSCILVTTEKDAVKFPEDFPAFVLCIKIQWINGEKEFVDSLRKVVEI